MTNFRTSLKNLTALLTQSRDYQLLRKQTNTVVSICQQKHTDLRPQGFSTLSWFEESA